MSKVAILIDGGYFLKRLPPLSRPASADGWPIETCEHAMLSILADRLHHEP